MTKKDILKKCLDEQTYIIEVNKVKVKYFIRKKLVITDAKQLQTIDRLIKKMEMDNHSLADFVKYLEEKIKDEK